MYISQFPSRVFGSLSFTVLDVFCSEKYNDHFQMYFFLKTYHLLILASCSENIVRSKSSLMFCADVGR